MSMCIPGPIVLDIYALLMYVPLAAAGFNVEVVFGHELVRLADCEKMGVTPNEPVFHCTKPAM